MRDLLSEKEKKCEDKMSKKRGLKRVEKFEVMKI